MLAIQFQFSFCYSLSHNTTYARLSPKKLIICNIFLHNQRMYSKITLGDMFSKKKNLVRTYLDKDVLSKIRWKSVKQNAIFLPFIIEALFTIYINIKWGWISTMNNEYVLWIRTMNKGRLKKVQKVKQILLFFQKRFHLHSFRS
jgi:hypothetical protein